MTDEHIAARSSAQTGFFYALAAYSLWGFLPLYFLLVMVIRVIGLALDGYDPSTIRGLVLAGVLFAIAEFGLQVFRRASRKLAAA